MTWDINDIFNENVNIDVEQIEDSNPDLYVMRSEEALKKKDINNAINEIDKAIKYAGKKKDHYIMEKIKILQAAKNYKQCGIEIEKNIVGFYKNLSKQEFFWILKLYERIYKPSKVRNLINKNYLPEDLGYLYRIDGRITDASKICLAEEISRNENVYEATRFLKVMLQETMSETLGMELIKYLKILEDYTEVFFWYEKIMNCFRMEEFLYPEMIQLAKQKGTKDRLLRYCEEYIKINFYDCTAIDVISEQLCQDEKYRECTIFLKQRIGQIKNNARIGALHKRLAWCYDMIGRNILATIHYHQAIRYKEISKVPKERPTRKKILLQRTILCTVPVLLLLCVVMYSSLIKEGVLETNYTSVLSTMKYDTLLVGENIKVETTFEKRPSFGIDGIVTYESKTPDIIAVEKDGTVKALKAGIGTIEVYINNKVYESITVYVENPEVKDIIIVESQEIIGECLDTFNIYAMVKMNNERAKPEAITYRSTDTNVAEVDTDGKVTLVGYGECEIQLKAGDFKKGIPVYAKPRVNKVLFNGSEDTTIVLEEGESISYSIEVNTTPENVPVDYEFRILDESVVVRLEEGTITALSQGYTQICIEVFQKKFYLDICVVERTVVTELNIIVPEETNNNDMYYHGQDLELIAGESQEIKCEVVYTPSTSPTPEIKYTVVEEEKGTITVSEDGVIYGMKPGHAELHIEARDMKKVVFISVVAPPISTYQIQNLKAKYLSNNQYELSWDVIDDYPNADYQLYVKREWITGEKETEFYEAKLVSNNRIIIEVLPNWKKIEVKVCGVSYEESKPSNEVILTKKETPKFDFTLETNEYNEYICYDIENYLNIQCDYKHFYREKGTDEVVESSPIVPFSNLDPEKTYEFYIVAYWNEYVVGETDVMEYKLNQ